MVEYAYFDGKIRGNSRVAESYLNAVKDFVTEANVRELAFSAAGISAILLTEPVLVFVMVEGGIADAKLQARKVFRDLGFEKKADLDEIFEFAEKIEEMPIEEVIRRIGKN